MTKVYLKKRKVEGMHLGEKDLIFTDRIYTIIIKRNDGNELKDNDLKNLFGKEIITELNQKCPLKEAEQEEHENNK